MPDQRPHHSACVLAKTGHDGDVCPTSARGDTSSRPASPMVTAGGLITDITVVQVEPGEQHLAWLDGIHELKERLGVRGITAQSSGVSVSIGTAIESLHRSWQRDHPTTSRPVPTPSEGPET